MSSAEARSCESCGRGIDGCMGFVKAGDVLEARHPIRELCGRCALVYQWEDSGGLVKSSISVS